MDFDLQASPNYRYDHADMDGSVESMEGGSTDQALLRAWRDRVLLVPMTDAATPESTSAELRKVLTDQKLPVEVLHALGCERLQEGDVLRAHACFAVAADDVRAIGAVASLVRCDIRLGRIDLAEQQARALVRDHPAFAFAWQVFGEVLAAQQRFGEAVASLRKAIELSPERASLFQALGDMARAAGMFEAARDAYVRSVELEPDNIQRMAALLSLKRRLFDWSGLTQLSARLKHALTQTDACVLPFEFISEGASAQQQCDLARRVATRLIAAAARDPLPPVKTKGPAGAKLRVGFVGYGFGVHPLAVSTSALFEQWRDSSLEVHLFATSPDSEAPERRRLKRAAHALHDVSGEDARGLARRVRELGIDVLVDLNGYSGAYRPLEFAYRAAPVQVSWMGYPGTTGAPYMDYLIADRFVLPPAEQVHFIERVVYLPRCYLPSDPTRVVGEPPGRAACGLPEQGVVYACFNTHYKLNPRSVGRMLAVLRAVPGSVLWLLKPVGMGGDRLRAQARAVGVDPRRLVFMQKLPHLDYLPRYRHADLFLDTENFNAHSTALDAIWAGCPVLTRPGDTFATRVAGSINHHLGMPELNVANDRDFVALAVQVGRDAHFRQQLRTRLATRKPDSGQFDTGAFAADMHGLLQRMVDHNRRGGTAADFVG